MQNLEYFGWWLEASLHLCGFFASMYFRRFLHIVSKISSVKEKSITYVQDELWNYMRAKNPQKSAGSLLVTLQSIPNSACIGMVNYPFS